MKLSNEQTELFVQVLMGAWIVLFLLLVVYVRIPDNLVVLGVKINDPSRVALSSVCLALAAVLLFRVAQRRQNTTVRELIAPAFFVLILSQTHNRAVEAMNIIALVLIGAAGTLIFVRRSRHGVMTK